MADDQGSPSPAASSQDVVTENSASGRQLRGHLVRELQLAIKTRTEQPEEASALAKPAEASALLRDALRERATDIHLDTQLTGVLVRLRIDGIMLDGAFLPYDIGFPLINQFKNMARLVPHSPFQPKEGPFTIR